MVRFLSQISHTSDSAAELMTFNTGYDHLVLTGKSLSKVVLRLIDIVESAQLVVAIVVSRLAQTLGRALQTTRLVVAAVGL